MIGMQVAHDQQRNPLNSVTTQALAHGARGGTNIDDNRCSASGVEQYRITLPNVASHESPVGTLPVDDDAKAGHGTGNE